MRASIGGFGPVAQRRVAPYLVGTAAGCAAAPIFFPRRARRGRGREPRFPARSRGRRPTWGRGEKPLMDPCPSRMSRPVEAESSSRAVRFFKATISAPAANKRT